MKNVLDLYEKFCHKKGLTFEDFPSVKTYDNTTLFCSAGMQQYKNLFENSEIREMTLANNQACLRVNDLEELGDGKHAAYFHMLGLFSFRGWTMKQAVDCWLEFIEDILGLKISKFTIHPDKKDWVYLFQEKQYDLIKLDSSCKWSDGDIEGYCTEFYVDDVEIGNIVNPLGDCIDAGFGLERLEALVHKNDLPYSLGPTPRYELLSQAAHAIEHAGYKASNKEQGYVLRKILRMMWKEGEKEHILSTCYMLAQEITRQKKLEKLYKKLKDKFPDKPKEWWFETHGIEL